VPAPPSTRPRPCRARGRRAERKGAAVRRENVRLLTTVTNRADALVCRNGAYDRASAPHPLPKVAAGAPAVEAFSSKVAPQSDTFNGSQTTHEHTSTQRSRVSETVRLIMTNSRKNRRAKKWGATGARKKRGKKRHQTKCHARFAWERHSFNSRPNTFIDKQSQIAERKTGNGRGPGNHSREAV